MDPQPVLEIFKVQGGNTAWMGVQWKLVRTEAITTEYIQAICHSLSLHASLHLSVSLKDVSVLVKKA